MGPNHYDPPIPLLFFFLFFTIFMPSFRCSICLDTLDDATKPMTTLCGHIYCLDCATFHFSREQPSCAVCRKPHSLDQMIRLYPDWEDADANVGSRAVQEDESVSSSPVSVRSIERVGEEAVDSIKLAIAGRQEPQDAFLTYVSVFFVLGFYH